MKKRFGSLLMGLVLAGCAGSPDGAAELQENPLLASAKTQATLHADVSAEGVDCAPFTGYTATLGTLTVDCLGTIAPDAYAVTSGGRLERTFSECKLDPTRLLKIDQLLSLQRREDRLPHVRECFAGAYADFVRSFADSGITACPAWQKRETVNPITSDVIDDVVPMLGGPAAHALEVAEMKPMLNHAGVRDALEVKHIYDTRLEGASGDIGATAERCAGGFAGFVIRSQADSVLTDPPAWLLDTQYDSAKADPYLRPGYYHPMSWYPAPPGVAFGAWARFSPCVPNASGEPQLCNPELCTYYAGGLHKAAKLQKDCADPSDESTCNSYCGPLIIK